MLGIIICKLKESREGDMSSLPVSSEDDYTTHKAAAMACPASCMSWLITNTIAKVNIWEKGMVTPGISLISFMHEC